MGNDTLQVIAGFTSSAIFVASNLPMLYKAFRTKNLRSYSLGHITLANIGNLIHWLYVAALPFGPIYFLHGFNTLVWYLRYEKGLDHNPAFNGRVPIPNDAR